MPSITINENDNTLRAWSSVSSDNIVYVVGNTITGPGNEPTLLGSRKEFVTTFGSYGPERDDKSWKYAANILTAGFPVLFYRVTDKGVGTTEQESLIQYASAEVLDNYVSEDDAKQIGLITDKFGGSLGNSLSYSIEVNTDSVYIRIYRDARQVETVRLIEIEPDDTEEEIRAKEIYALQNYDFNTIKFDITSPDDFLLVDTASSSVQLTGGTDASATDIIAELPNVYDTLKDKYVYDVKFITSGGYVDAVSTSTPIANAMINLAEARQDCVAILDMPLGTKQEDAGSYWSGVDTSYATAYAPWFLFKFTDKSQDWMPPSFIFLYTLAKYIRAGNEIWFPPAGINRGSVAEAVKPEYEIGGAVLDEWQETNSQKLNPIMRIRNYGYVIWGESTLYNLSDTSPVQTSAFQELGVRITINEIKRIIFIACLELTFEQNNLKTWNEFRGKLDPELTQIKADGGITDYQIIMDDTVTSTDDQNENVIRGIVRISVARSAQDFDINVDIEPQSVIFAEDADEFII